MSKVIQFKAVQSKIKKLLLDVQETAKLASELAVEVDEYILADVYWDLMEEAVLYLQDLEG